MRNFTITKDPIDTRWLNNRYIEPEITNLVIRNSDANPLIDKVKISDNDWERYTIEVDFNSSHEHTNTFIQELKASYSQVGNVFNSNYIKISGGWSELRPVIIDLNDKDSLPLNCLQEINSNFTFSLIDRTHMYLTKLFNELVNRNAHEDALLHATESYNKDAMLMLANTYKEQNQIEKYITVLGSIPEDNIQFKYANLELVRALLEYPHELPNKLERTFRAAYFAGEEEIAGRCFKELSGMQDIMPQNTGIKPNDPESLIQIAQQLRENMQRFNVASHTTAFSLFASRTPVEDITGTATESENEQKYSI